MTHKIPAICLNEIKFILKLGTYQNIITFFNENNISFLSKMKLNFDNIPLSLHGNGYSENLLEYLANNKNSDLIFNFFNFFLNSVNIKTTNSEKIIFEFIKNDKWQDINLLIYISQSPTTTTTPTTTIAPNIFYYTINTTYSGYTYFELDYDTDLYSESEIGIITINNGDDTTIDSIYDDGYMSSEHEYSPAGIYDVVVTTTGTAGFDPINLFMNYGWQAINSLDLSIFKNLYYVEVGDNMLDTFVMPTEHHKEWGFSISFWNSPITEFNWPNFNYSDMIASDSLSLTNLPNLTTLNIPNGSRLSISLYDIPQLTTIDHSEIIIIDDYSQTNKCTYIIKNLPNVTSLSLPEFNANMDNIRLQNIGISGPIDLGITSSICDDLFISGITNLTELTFGSTTGITTQWLNIIGSNTTTLDLSKIHINYSPNFYSQSQLGISNNPNLTTLTNIGVSTGKLISINISNNPNLGYVDFSNIGGISTSTAARVHLDNNNWDAATINQVLVVLDSKTTLASSGRIFSVIGTISPNSYPDSSSGGFDGLAAKASLQAKNVTFFPY